MISPSLKTLRLSAAPALLLLGACTIARRVNEPCALALVGAAELVGRDSVSTPASEVRLTVSPDGTRQLWGTVGRAGGPGGFDIWERRRTANAWSAPTPVSFNTSANDFDPFFAPDGSGVYFFSNRAGGAGGDDLYFARVAPDGEYGPVENLGTGVNTKGDEWGPSVSPDGARMLFASDGHAGAGKHDLLTARRLPDGHWGDAMLLPGRINGPLDDFDATFLSDGRTIVFARETVVGTDTSATLRVSYLDGAAYSEPVMLPPGVNADGAWNFGTSISRSAPGVLFFTSHHEGAVGRSDLYRITYREPAPGCRALPASAR